MFRPTREQLPATDLRPWLIVPLGLAVGMVAIFAPHLAIEGSFAWAGDYRRYYAAVHLLLSGRNPYNQATLIAAAQHIHSIPMSVNLAADGFVLLPFVLWPLIPLSLLPFWLSFILFITVSFITIALTLAHLARTLGWRHWWLVPVFACLWWPVAWGRIVGQLDFIILIGAVAACSLIGAKRNALAGVALASVWVQPELAWIAGVAVVILLWGDRRALLRLVLGFLTASTILFIISAFVPHGILSDWFASGGVFLHREASHEFQLLGLPALVQAIIPHDFKAYGVTSAFSLVAAAVGAIAAIATGVWLKRSQLLGTPSAAERALWVVFAPTSIWLLVTPYGHSENAILLLPLLLLTMGADAKAIAHSPAQIFTVGTFVVITTLFTGTVLFLDLLPLATFLLLLSAARSLATECGRRKTSPPISKLVGGDGIAVRAPRPT